MALLAGLFRMEPHDLVADTSYPLAKSDRLPVVVARWTEVEHQLALLQRDLWWIDHVAAPVTELAAVDGVLAGWADALADLATRVLDPSEVDAVATARRTVADRRARSTAAD